MPEIIHIHQRPTFDLTDIGMRYFDGDNGLCYFESRQVFRFDKVYGNLENRSRLIRLNKPESEIAQQIVSATIDAGYCGHLVWKTVLTKKGIALLQAASDIQQCLVYFSGCQQIHLFSSPAGNYYHGSNQTNLDPDIIFTDDP
jgi:hypothetical protein